MIILAAFMILYFFANWRLFQKMGAEGWESIVPVYNTYVLFKILYGSGWKMFLLLIPFYNIYVYIKLCIDFAHQFNKTTGFGIGILFLAPIFECIMAFDGCVFRDGSMEINRNDFISRFITKMCGEDTANAKDDALAKLEKLVDLRDAGIITAEEYEAKKKELLDRI